MDTAVPDSAGDFPSRAVRIVLALAFAAVVFLPFSTAGLFGAYIAGGFVAGSEIELLIEWIWMAFVYRWLFIVAFDGYRAYAVALDPNLDGLLTTVSHRDVIGGFVVTELFLWSTLLLTVGSAATVAFALGAG